MAQKRIPALLKLFPGGSGARKLGLVLFGAIALGILAGTATLGPSGQKQGRDAEALTELPERSELPPERSELPPKRSELPPERSELPPERSELPPDPGPAAAAAAEPLLPGLTGLPSMTGVWVTLFLFMLVGVGLVVLVTRSRRFRAGNGSLHVVDSISLGGRRLIHLIRCGDRKYLIGNSEKGIQYLASLPTDPLENEIERTLDRREGERTFEELLGQGRERA